MKIEIKPMANPTRVHLKIQFEASDFNEISADYPNQSFMELYEEFLEYKTKTVHNIITSEQYRDKVLYLSVVDHVYELWHDLMIIANEHNPNRELCQFCTLEFNLECDDSSSS